MLKRCQILDFVSFSSEVLCQVLFLGMIVVKKKQTNVCLLFVGEWNADNKQSDALHNFFSLTGGHS